MQDLMNVVITEKFDTTSCEFYQDSKNEIWLTREQIGKALGYANPAKAIQKLHLEHKDRMDLFSVQVKEKTVDTLNVRNRKGSESGVLEGMAQPSGFSKNSNLLSTVTYYSQRGVMEICRWSEMPRANDFMDWVYDVIEAYRRNEIVASKQAIESLKTQLLEQDKKFNMLSERVEQVGALVQSSVKELKTEVFSHIDLLESKSEVMLTHETDWAMDMMEHVRKIADVYTSGNTSKCMDRLIERAEEYLGEPYKNYEADYALRHNGKKGKRIFVMARDEDSRNAFEQAIKDFEIEFGIYEQNEGQKYLESIMGDPLPIRHKPTNEELEAEWEAMTKMYGEGWDK